MTDSKPDLTTTSGKLSDLRSRLEEAQAPLGRGTAEADRGDSPDGNNAPLTARERVLSLLDESSFVETDALARHRVTELKMDRNRPATDGVVTGYGSVAGRRVCVFSQDDSIFDGALGEVYGEKILKIYDLAMKTGVPIVGIHAADGTRVIEGVAALNLNAKLLAASSEASGLIPQIAVVAGANVGLAAMAPNLADLVIQVEGATTHLVTADVVSKVTGTPATEESLGGASVHSQTTGLAHLTASSDAESLTLAREVLGFLPINNHAEAPRTGELVTGTLQDNLRDADRELDNLIPDSDAAAYDAVDVIIRVVDDAALRQVQPDFAANVVTGFARIEGRAVGIVANQPTVLAGCLDNDGAAKAARFIRMCDAFNLPIVEFVDSPGFLPSTEQEHAGAARAAAQLTYAFAEATVGKLSVVTRKALGAAYVVMGSKGIGADLAYAWPTAQIAVADAPTAATALYGEDHDEAQSTEWAAEHLTPYRAAESGLIDAVIEPAHTRGHLIEALRLLDRKVVARRPKKHGNIPL